MFYIVAYDISRDRLRSQVSKLLTAVGTRVQRSVFELELEPHQLARVLQSIHALLDAGDSLRCYPLCGKCVQTAQNHNRTPLARDLPFYLV